MYQMTAKITIGNLQFNFCNSVEIESSVQNLTDTCRIIQPKKLLVDGQPLVAGGMALIKIGDKVKVELGYEHQYDTVFTGYVRDVKTKIPVEIICEDEMFQLKQYSLTRTYESVRLRDLVEYATSKLQNKPKIIYTDPNIQLGKFRINYATGAQVLEELRKTYGLYSFFRDGVLYVGVPYSLSDPSYRKDVKLRFDQNMVMDNLTYKNAEDSKVLVRASSVRASDNKVIKTAYGDPNGTVQKLELPNMDVDSLNKYAKRLYESLKYTGYMGDFVTFGKPYVRHGDAVMLHDPDLPERDGNYLVQKVVRSFSEAGYRQNITLERKLS